MAKKPKLWIQEIKLKEGSLRATAARHGAMTKDGTISIHWLRRMAKEHTLTGRRARLALKFRSFHKN